MRKYRHHVSDVIAYESSSSSDEYTRIRRPRHSRHGSVISGNHNHRHHHVHEPAYAAPNLAVPVVDVGGRQRASSTSGLPQPNIIINTDVSRSGSHSRSRSRERVRPRSRSRGRRYDDDDIYEEIIERRGRISRSPSPYYHRVERVHQGERADRGKEIDYETRKALEKLKIMEEEKEREETHRRLKAEMEIKKAKEELAKAEAEAKRKADQKKTIEDWQREQDAKKAKEKKEKEQIDKMVEEGIRNKWRQSGLSEEQIDVLIKGEEKNKRRAANELMLQGDRRTFIKVHKKHLLPETLSVYGLPWSYDNVCPLPRRWSLQN
jgi:hypothetical protein